MVNSLHSQMELWIKRRFVSLPAQRCDPYLTPAGPRRLARALATLKCSFVYTHTHTHTLVVLSSGETTENKEMARNQLRLLQQLQATMAPNAAWKPHRWILFLRLSGRCIYAAIFEVHPKSRQTEGTRASG